MENRCKDFYPCIRFTVGNKGRFLLDPCIAPIQYTTFVSFLSRSLYSSYTTLISFLSQSLYRSYTTLVSFLSRSLYRSYTTLVSFLSRSLFTFPSKSVLYLFKYIQVIFLIRVGNTQLVKMKVTYLVLNVETAQSSVISIAVPTFDQTDKYTLLLYALQWFIEIYLWNKNRYVHCSKQ